MEGLQGSRSRRSQLRVTGTADAANHKHSHLMRHDQRECGKKGKERKRRKRRKERMKERNKQHCTHTHALIGSEYGISDSWMLPLFTAAYRD